MISFMLKTKVSKPPDRVFRTRLVHRASLLKINRVRKDLGTRMFDNLMVTFSEPTFFSVSSDLMSTGKGLASGEETPL